MATAPKAIGFELGTMFAPFGRIYDLETYRRWMSIPNLIGAKHSSLSRELELALEMTDYALRSLGVPEERCKLLTQRLRNEGVNGPQQDTAP